MLPGTHEDKLKLIRGTSDTLQLCISVQNQENGLKRLTAIYVYIYYENTGFNSWLFIKVHLSLTQKVWHMTFVTYEPWSDNCVFIYHIITFLTFEYEIYSTIFQKCFGFIENWKYTKKEQTFWCGVSEITYTLKIIVKWHVW